MSKMAKGPFMEFLKSDLRETAPNTFTERAIDCPVSRTETMAMLIHQIELFAQVCDAVAGETLVKVGSIQGETGFKMADQGVLAKYEVFNLDTPTQSQPYEHYIKYFDPPVLYAKAHIYHAIKGNGNTEIRFSECVIGYTVEKVSQTDFISALVE